MVKDSSCVTQLSMRTKLSQQNSKRPSSAKRLKRKKAVEQSKKENYDDTIWETNVDASVLYFPVMISENLIKESKKRNLSNSPPKLRYAPKWDSATEGSSHQSDASKEAKSNLTHPESTIITTGAFTIEGGIVDESSGSELPPHTVCITNCSASATKARIEEKLSCFGEVTGVQLYTASRPPVAYVTFRSKAACKACVSAELEKLMGSDVFTGSSAVRCHQKKLTEAEAREASSGRLLYMLKRKRSQAATSHY
ncbi:RNA recognition motif domain [Trinorchestia longiramus]|nr:RNA recognition motif domain [Trinorchestia longiramus]